MPSGHVPIHVLEHPEQYGGIDCRIQVPQEALDVLRNMLTEEEGPRDEHLSWYPYIFAEEAADVFKAIGEPVMTIVNGWDIFQRMAAVMHDRGMT
jgi:hypothetical protein